MKKKEKGEKCHDLTNVVDGLCIYELLYEANKIILIIYIYVMSMGNSSLM